SGVQFYVDGKPVAISVELDEINQDTKGVTPIRIGQGGGLTKGFTGRIDEARIYTAVLPPEQVAVLATTETLDKIAATPEAQRTPGQREKLRLARLERYGPGEL